MSAQTPKPRVGGRSACSQCGQVRPPAMMENGVCVVCRTTRAGAAPAPGLDATQQLILKLQVGDILLLRGANDVSKLQSAAKVVQRILPLHRFIGVHLQLRLKGGAQVA